MTYNTIPKTEEEPLIADAPKASHKSTAVIAAVCLLSAVAGFNNQKIYNTLFYTSGQLYLSGSGIDGQVCLAIDDEASCTAYGECCVWDKSACYYNAEDDDWLTGSKLHQDCPRN